MNARFIQVRPSQPSYHLIPHHLAHGTRWRIRLCAVCAIVDTLARRIGVLTTQPRSREFCTITTR
jgi:hypothetical protein